jgi:hypothetical protein
MVIGDNEVRAGSGGHLFLAKWVAIKTRDRFQRACQAGFSTQLSPAGRLLASAQ